MLAGAPPGRFHYLTRLRRLDDFYLTCNLGG
jgi:hypothetical protein